jgi:hypothetical protein
MLHYTYAPSARTAERLLLVPGTTLTMLCVSCGDAMKHARTIAKLGVLPQQFVFVCPSCKGVDAREGRLVE